MAKITDTVSRTFIEYRFLQGETLKDCVPDNISLKTIITKHRFDNDSKEKAISRNVPLISAAMQAVTGPKLAITLAQEGGLGVIEHVFPAPVPVDVLSGLGPEVLRLFDRSGVGVFACGGRHRERSLVSVLITSGSIAQRSVPWRCRSR